MGSDLGLCAKLVKAILIIINILFGVSDQQKQLGKPLSYILGG